MKLSEYFEKIEGVGVLATTGPKYLIYFHLDKVLPLIGEGD